MRKAAVIELNGEERQTLRRLAKARSSKRHEALRAQALLLAAEGQTNLQISDQVGLHYNAIGKTRARFVQERLGALQDRPRSGRKPTIAAGVKGRILSEATQPPRRAWPAGACAPWPPTGASRRPPSSGSGPKTTSNRT